MDKQRYEEMKANAEDLFDRQMIQGKTVYLFGHCNASEELADLLMEKGCHVKAILDNNPSKQGFRYKGIPVVLPEKIREEGARPLLVCIAARASAAMWQQLRQMGYTGEIETLVEYNSYADYSLSQTTIAEKRERLKRGFHLLEQEKRAYSNYYRIYCPFCALGDVYYMMAYLPYFLKKKGVRRYVVFTIGQSCADVVKLFGAEHVEALSQNEMDESIQAVLYTRDANAYIPHQDRPYTVKLAKALYLKRIPLEMIYKYGVYGLDKDYMPYKPVKLEPYKNLGQIIPGKAIVLSPYAKSVTGIPKAIWESITAYYRKKGCQLFTNVAEGEAALPGTIPLQTRLVELQSAVERAGTFIGLRSGLCDVLKEANCKKIALYPDCYYSDTKWKMEEIYHLDGWENIVLF